MEPTENAMIEELAHLQRRMKILERALRSPSNPEQKNDNNNTIDQQEQSKSKTTRIFHTVM